MFLFRSNKNDIVDKIDDLDLQNQILYTRLKSMKTPYNHLFFAFFFTTLALGIIFKLDHWWIWGATGLLSIGVWIMKWVRIKYTKRKIKNNKKKLKQSKEIMENDEEIEQYRKFLNSFINNTSVHSKSKTKITRSLPVKIFDFLFHTYNHNPKAIICQVCGANNGLCDDPKNVQYFCYNCGCNEKGEEFELVSEEEEEEKKKSKKKKSSSDDEGKIKE